MTKKISQRALKSNSTRQINIYEKIENEMPALYKKRMHLMDEFMFFYNVEEHRRLPKLDVKKLNEARSSIVLKIMKVDKEIEVNCLKMIEAHAKYMNKLREWHGQQTELELDGFKINNK